MLWASSCFGIRKVLRRKERSSYVENEEGEREGMVDKHRTWIEGSEQRNGDQQCREDL